MLRHVIASIIFAMAMVAAAQTTGTADRLDLRPGFREFKFKTPKENYMAIYSLEKRNTYRWPDIVEIYACNYRVKIGNVQTDSVHVFFLGNRLVRTTVFLSDTISTAYLHKFFGESELISEPDITAEEAKEKMGDMRYMYATQRRWQADMVRMESRKMYLRKGNSVEKKECLDFYLNDFNDMINIFSR
ncbi:MAG: hypothetical protein J6U33_00775 [Paludibacteraceae bacterium]|nr:hypothetical protein [Paludibacteraceae bacterium]